MTAFVRVGLRVGTEVADEPWDLKPEGVALRNPLPLPDREPPYLGNWRDIAPEPRLSYRQRLRDVAISRGCDPDFANASAGNCSSQVETDVCWLEEVIGMI